MTKPSSMNFEEAQLEASKIHPDAKAVVNQGKWFYLISTNVNEDVVFPENKKGTPAWVAYTQINNNGNNELDEWVEANGHDELPFHLMIDVYNIEANKELLADEIHQQLLVKAGIPLTKQEIFASEDSIFNASAWLEFKNQAYIEAEEQTETAIDKIYGIE